LVYLRDITKLIESKRKSRVKNAKLDGKLLLNNPFEFMSNVTDILLILFDNNLNLEI